VQLSATARLAACFQIPAHHLGQGQAIIGDHERLDPLAHPVHGRRFAPGQIFGIGL